LPAHLLPLDSSPDLMLAGDRRLAVATGLLFYVCQR